MYTRGGDDEDENEASAAQRPPRWFPAWPFVYLMGSELLLVGGVMSGAGGTSDGHQMPQWVFKRLHVMDVVKEGG